MNTTAAQQEPPRQAGTFTKRIGSTTFRVGVYYSDTSRETMDDKIIRLIRNEAGKAVEK